ncbi:hypothetical protein SAMN05421736_12471 [Evansella caseinilytica]|uniref:Uncharacterized protein n=1 Tax=Evansella caseinilytica TaxID=1503961 RepID=A0A1H3URH3_9BACI|nr:hypothetical protein SAMN05421736_12471 [Evansella caseinilytica]
MNNSISGALLLLAGLMTITFLSIAEFVYQKIILMGYTGVNITRMAFDDFTLLFIFSVLLILLGIIMICYDVYLSFRKNK